MTLVDTNILLDVFNPPNAWSDLSAIALGRAADRGPLLINDVVFAEVSVGFLRLEEVEEVLAEAGVTQVPMPRGALFAAGKAFRAYRRRGGTRSGVLPDFFIGAHAAIADLPLLTRDPRRYQAYFPSVTLIHP